MRGKTSVVAWISFSVVIPRACSGIQLKILIILVFLLCPGYRGQATV
ncbi:MAG: hypothetical protein ACEY3D_08515 [Rickettsia sp.]